MNHRSKDRLGRLLGVHEECGFLGPAEVEKLLNGELDGRRRREFDEHAAECPDCALLVDEHRQLQRLAEGHPTKGEEADALETATRILESRRSSPAPRRLPRRSALSWSIPAAAVLFLAALFAVWSFSRGPVMLQEVDPRSYDFLPPLPVRGPDATPAWNRAAEAWRKGDLRRVVEVLEKAPPATPADEATDAADRLFYIGLARLALGESRPAVRLLRRAAALEQPFVEEDTHWFLAVALERSGRHRQACAELLLVEKIRGSHAEHARRARTTHCR